MGLLSDRPVLIRVVAVEIPASDRLDSPRRAYQRLEIPAIFGGQFLRCIQQLFNSPQNDIFGFVEDVISFSGQLHVFTPFRCCLSLLPSAILIPGGGLTPPGIYRKESICYG